MTGDVPLFALDQTAYDVPARRIMGPLTLEIPQARMVAIVGHNGSGKSTLARLLARQARPSLGGLRFLGTELKDWKSGALARALAYLPQDLAPAHGMSVRELVALGRIPWHGALGRFGAPDREAVDRALDLTALEPLSTRLVETLSGGERQRAWTAMLVAQQARCLLLDEPISALDLAHQLELLALLRRLVDESGLSVLLVLHDINMAARFCDDVVALRSGGVMYHGGIAAFMDPARLHAVYGVHVDILRQPGTGIPVALPAAPGGPVIDSLREETCSE